MVSGPIDGVKPHDIVVWGATGFTGRLVAGVLDRDGPEGLAWAIGGRDRAKLETLRRRLRTEPDVVVGDAGDPGSLAPIVRNARVVVSTVGPFARHGDALVETCVERGVDYCDITGETQWIRRNVDRWHSRAVETGARIVHCCGFDSVPSDLGVWMLHDALQRGHGRSLQGARTYVTKIKGGFSGGTVASILDVLEEAAADRDVRRILADPYALNPEGERRGPDGGDQRGVRYDDALGRWTAPFLMAGINTRIVRRTNALLGYPYGRDFRYAEVVSAKSRLQARMVSLGLSAMVLGGVFRPTRWLLRKFLPAPGQGPSAAERDAGSFELLLLGRGDGDPAVRVRGRVRGEHDPGYGETSRMLAAAALCLAFDELPARGGILTPAACMGPALLERLRRAGMTFDVSVDQTD